MKKRMLALFVAMTLVLAYAVPAVGRLLLLIA